MALDIRTKLVHTSFVKNITFSANDRVIELARRRAITEATTLNELFRQWLLNYATRDHRATACDDLMQRLGHISSGGKFSREEMNER